MVSDLVVECIIKQKNYSINAVAKYFKMRDLWGNIVDVLIDKDKLGSIALE